MGRELDFQQEARESASKRRVWVSPMALVDGKVDGAYHHSWRPETYVGADVSYSSGVNLRLPKYVIPGNIVRLAVITGRERPAPGDMGGSLFGEAGACLKQLSFAGDDDAANFITAHVLIVGLKSQAGYQVDIHSGRIARFGGSLTLTTIVAAEVGDEKLNLSHKHAQLSFLAQVGYAF